MKLRVRQPDHTKPRKADPLSDGITQPTALPHEASHSWPLNGEPLGPRLYQTKYHMTDPLCNEVTWSTALSYKSLTWQTLCAMKLHGRQPYHTRPREADPFNEGITQPRALQHKASYDWPFRWHNSIAFPKVTDHPTHPTQWHVGSSTQWERLHVLWNLKQIYGHQIETTGNLYIWFHFYLIRKCETWYAGCFFT